MKKYLVLILLATTLLWGSVDVYADDKNKTTEATTEDSSSDTSSDTKKSSSGNNGSPKDNPFCNSGAPVAYKEFKYYDFAVPYKKTIKEIGGYATSAETTGLYSFHGSDNDWGNTQHGLLNIFNTTTGDLSSNVFDSSGYDDNLGGLMYVEKDGVRFYCGALGQGLYANSALGWSLSNTGLSYGGDYDKLMGSYYPCQAGLLFDVILKDGTQYHFCEQSAMGIGHSIGGENAGQDGINYNKAKLNYQQYKCCWHTDNPWQLVEVSAKSGSSTAGIAKAMGISDENPVMYIRVWVASLYMIGNSGKKASTFASDKDGVSKGTELSEGSPDDSSSDPVDGAAEGTTSAQYLANGYWSEEQLAVVTKINEDFINLTASRNDFTSKELGALSDWEQNVHKMNEKDSIFYYVRIITMIIGIIFTVWMLLIYIAYWFDRLNNIIDIDLLPILTFHRLRLSDTEETCTFRASDLAKTDTRTVNHRAILGICIVGVAFGALVISGTLYVAIMTLVQKVFNLLGIGG